MGRRLFVRRVWEDAQTAVHRLQGELPAIIVTTTPTSHLPSTPIGSVRTVQLCDVLAFGNGRPVVLEDPFVSLVSGQPERTAQEGLSFRPMLGHRHVTWLDLTFTFTPLQAKVVEILDDAGKAPVASFTLSLSGGLATSEDGVRDGFCQMVKDILK